MHIPGYIFREQFDSHEFLLYILAQIYSTTATDTTIPADCMFKIDSYTDVDCRNCNHTTDREERQNHLNLNVKDDPTIIQSINELLINYNLEWNNVPQYNCDNCRTRGMCYKKPTITAFNDVIIIQLVLFTYNESLQIAQKNCPALIVEENISLFGESLQLCGIIYHHGLFTANSGHYTAAINSNGNWFTLDDSETKSGVKLSCNYRDRVIPYILIYRRTNATVNNINNVIVSDDEETHFCINDMSDIPKYDANMRKSFENLAKVIEIDSQCDSSDTLSITKKSVVQELFNQTERIAAVQENSSTPWKGIKRKSKFASPSKANQSDKERKKDKRINLTEEEKAKLSEKDKQRKESERQNIPKEEKAQLVEKDKQRKESEHQNLTEEEKAKLTEKDKQRKESERQNLTAEEKAKLSEKDKQRKESERQNIPKEEKAKLVEKDKQRKESERQNLTEEEKAKLTEKYKQRKESERQNLTEEEKAKTTGKNRQRMMNERQNLPEEEKAKQTEKDKQRKERERKNLPKEEKAKQTEKDKQRKESERKIKDQEMADIFAEVDNQQSKVDHSILKTRAYQIVKSKFENAIKEGPTYICDVCCKYEFRSNVVKLDQEKYDDEIFNKCCTRTYDWICKKCHAILKKNKMPAEAQVNNLHLCDPVRF